MAKILYCCDLCAENESTMCGYFDRNELRVFGEMWLCDGCFSDSDEVPRDEDNMLTVSWSECHPPPEYVPAPEKDPI
jgi:hypothetical protein